MRPLRVRFICPSSPEPIGGNLALYELANGLARRGHDIHIGHAKMWERSIKSLDEISWFTFHPSIDHYIPDVMPREPWTGDVMFGSRAYDVDALPATYLQGVAIVDAASEWEAFRQPGLKVCVASWLIDVARLMGSHPDQWVVVPPGVDHDEFHLVQPVAGRPPSISMLLHDHPGKGTDVGLAALELVHEARPDARVTLFSAHPTGFTLPTWADYLFRPDHSAMRDLFNQSAVFLQSANYEGFGLPAVQAMACGAALVTTDNGGSRDYAFHEQTALVTAPGDSISLAEAVIRLLDDLGERETLSQAGVYKAREFTWDRGAEILEAALASYVSDPESYLIPAGDAELPPLGSPGGWGTAVLEMIPHPPRLTPRSNPTGPR